MSEDSQNKWHFGRIKTYNDERGFGFVRDLSDQQEHFIHITKVKTPPISENEDVVFKLRPSTKKPDSFEAFDLIHLEEFDEDLGVLIQIFKEHTYPSSVRKNVLKSLKEPQLKYLFKEILQSYANEQDANWIKSITETIFVYSTGSYQDLNDDFFISIIEEIGNEELTLEIWDNEILPITPSREAIKSTFIKGDKKEKALLLNKIEDQSLKVDLLESVLSNETPEYALTLLRNYLIKKNQLSTSQVPPLDDKFWEDKAGYDLVVKCTTHFQETVSPSELLELSLEGYLDAFPKDFVFDNFREIGREKVMKIFESDFLDSDEKFQLMKSIIEFNNLVVSETKDSRVEANGEKLTEEEYWDKIGESYETLLKIANKTLDHEKIETLILGVLPGEIEYDFWVRDLIQTVPTKVISKKLLSGKLGLKELQHLISQEKLTKDVTVGIVKENLNNFGEIQSKSEFKSFHNHASILVEFDSTPTEDLVPTQNHPFLKASLWLNKKIAMAVDDIKPVFLFFEPVDQVKFVRHLFHLEHSESNVTVPNRHFYDLIDVEHASLKPNITEYEVQIDYSVLVLIQAMKSLQENGKLLFESELLKLFYKSIANNKHKAVKAEHFFDKCEGRYEDDYNWNTEGKIEKVFFGQNKFYYAISFKPGEQRTGTNRGGYTYTYFEKNHNFEYLKEEVRKLPGRKWNPDKEHWGVPAKYKEQVYEFAAENRFFIDMEGSNYKNNTHLAEFKRGHVPNGITYCEGRLSKKLDNKYGKEFWWCCGQPCFQNCKTRHSPADWENYTMLDMLKIKGFNLDDTNRVGDKIEDGQYYQFVSSINRFNQLVDHLYCKECEQVLYPVDDSHFAHYRVTHFHCANSKCSQYHQDVYLHHCLNGKCNGIIDSRVSAKCPNGLYICSNEACGTCCSTDMFKRRLDNLQQVGGYVHQDLRNAVQNNLGHLERKEYFCYNCGNGMNKQATDVYYCENCDITYEIGKDNYNSGSSSSGFNSMDDDLPF